MPYNVNVSVTPLVDVVGSVLPDVVSLKVAEGARLADHVDKVLIDSVGCPPWLWPGGGGGYRLFSRDWGGAPGHC